MRKRQFIIFYLTASKVEGFVDVITSERGMGTPEINQTQAALAEKYNCNIAITGWQECDYVASKDSQ